MVEWAREVIEDRVRASDDVVVLDDALAWEPDEIAALATVAETLGPSTRLIVAVRNVTWFPARLKLLQGVSPFGEGPVAERPLRFFARGTLLHALSAAGLTVDEIIAVRRPPPDAETVLDPGLIERLRAADDADVYGYVAVARR